MKKGNGYYMKNYCKDNAPVLICELVIVTLLAVICTVILEGDPVWLAPLMAFCAYLLAEIRFMMAYVATNARREAEEEEAAKASDAQLAEKLLSEDEDEEESEEATVAFVSVVDEDDAQDDRSDEAFTENLKHLQEELNALAEEDGLDAEPQFIDSEPPRKPSQATPDMDEA